MAGALGVNQRWLFTSVVYLGSTLAGLGGALQIPKEAVNLQMDIHIIAEAFVVVVIGGMGSVTGAFLAALLVGLLSAFGILVFPQLTLVLTFRVMAAVVMIRPYGLLGRPEAAARASAEQVAELPLRPADKSLRSAALALLVAMALLPAFASGYAELVATEILILALFAASLHFIMSIGGLVSFGHAAYFGLGAYTAGLLMQHLSAPMGVAVAAAPLVAAAVAMVFGFFVIRLSGVYLAMLTLAFAQIVWSVAFQSGWTGGDNGVLGIWPPAWLGSKTGYYYFVLAIVLLCLLFLRRVVFSPFGYALRAGRDSAVRSDAIGMDVRRLQWTAFVLAGAMAGLAGVLHAYHKGSVFPNVLAIPQSVDALVMVLLGGLQTLSGPVVGAAVYHSLIAEVMRSTEYWRAIVGAVIVLLVVAFPQGIAGFARTLFESRRVRRAGSAVAQRAS
jgi:branched-chain amino acid transport system permease protein